MPVVDRTAAPTSRNMDIRGYGSRIAFAALTCPGRRGLMYPSYRFKQQRGRDIEAVIASEAKQSMIGEATRRLDCFVASLLAMTTRYDSAFPRRDAPGSCMKDSPGKTEGVGNAGCPMHPQPRVQNLNKHTSVVTEGPPDSPGIPTRNGFNGLFRALPGDRACLSPSSARLAQT